MIRLFLVELRRSNAPAMGVLIAAVSMAALATDQQAWKLQWIRLAIEQAGALPIVVPLAMGGGAMLGRRERRTGADEVMASTARPRWQRITLPAAALAVTLIVAYLLPFALGGVVVSRFTDYASVRTLLVPLTDAPLLFGSAWLGYAAGRSWSSRLVPPVLAAASMAGQLRLSLLKPAEGRLTWLDSLLLVVAPPSYDWETVTGNAMLGRLALGVGMVAAGFLLAAATRWSTRATAVAVLAVALSAAAYLPGAGQDGAYGRYSVDRAAQRLVCSDGTPQVCVTAVHSRALGEATTQARRALELLARLPGAPQRAVEWRAATTNDYYGAVFFPEPDSVPVPAGTVTFDIDEVTGRPEPHLVENLIWGAGAPRHHCPPENDDDAVAKAAAGAWLMGTDHIPADSWPLVQALDTRVHDTVQKLRTVPAGEQVRRVAALRDAATACRPGLLPVLTGTHG
ncbi:hypothetical protein ACPCHT_09095 [Nucisporomicrobium flavum]|uniref:hypothetical protein n=1 Tax=Nucisporomicrobium flavum TaxID=2785915 RepID=UPI003C2EAE4A